MVLFTLLYMSEDSTSFPTYSIYKEKSSGKRRIFLIITVFMIVAASILAGLYLLGSASKKSAPIPVSPTIAVTATPLPTSSVSAVLTPRLTEAISTSPSAGLAKIDTSSKLDRAELDIVILNGSGVAGAAALVSDYLRDLGYTIVRVGNAESYTYKNLTILVKKNKSGFAGLLKKDLQANPSFASVSASISDDISTGAEVIVGK